MWSHGVISQWLPAHLQRRYRARRGATTSGWIRALAPWLAALETDSDQGVSQARRSEARVRAAEEQAEFERLFTQYGAALLDYLYGMTRNHEAATDLMQETFLRAWASATPTQRDPAAQSLALSHRHESGAQPEQTAAALRLAPAGDRRAARRGG